MNNKFSESLKYLTVSSEDESWGLSVTTIGFQIVKPFAPFPPAGHPAGYFYNPKQGRVLPEYGLLYFIKGKGTFSSAHVKKQNLEPGTLIMVFPGEWHTYEPHANTGWQCYWIHFKGGYADLLTKNHFFSKQEPVFQIGLNENLLELYNQAIYFATHEKTGFQQILSGITTNMLGLICYLKKNNHFKDKEMGEKINKSKSIMRERFEERIYIEKIAQQLNMSYSWFRKMFKVYTGISPAQYIMQLKLHRAKAYLTSSDMSIKEIAYELNFDNPNYFYVFFKQRSAMTPGQFRNQTKPRKSF